ncbi:unnamed protein product [Prorocentrum cordatum]|uniref:J domain-containing protein n=1 Tax=Prorocentrum cordatum TaxID=2364126 RepID=A0ABN9TPY6_9DINO|nr:unnamed protein product [Polarella glacialis]
MTEAPKDEKAEAERRFLEVTWAYETLSDPQKRAEHDARPPPRGGGGAEPPKAEPDWKRSDFSMKEAAEVFRRAFGEESSEYGALVDHLLRSAGGGGDAEHWRRHAEHIARLTRGGRGDFTVETEGEGPDAGAKTRTSLPRASGLNKEAQLQLRRSF